VASSDRDRGGSDAADATRHHRRDGNAAAGLLPPACEVLKSLKESAKLLIEDKIKALGVGHLFEVQKDRIKAPNGGFI